MSLPSWKSWKKNTKANVHCDIIQREAISSGHRRQICEICAAAPVAAPKNRESPAEEQPLHSVCCRFRSSKTYGFGGGASSSCWIFLVSKVLEKLNCGFLFVHIWRVSESIFGVGSLCALVWMLLQEFSDLVCILAYWDVQLDSCISIYMYIYRYTHIFLLMNFWFNLGKWTIFDHCACHVRFYFSVCWWVGGLVF